jgi:3-methyladenine DNA glycosylase Tag
MVYFDSLPSFDKYIWNFVNYKPIHNKFKSFSDLPANTKIEFSIRAKMCQSLKDILVDKDNQWQPLVDKKGKAIDWH